MNRAIGIDHEDAGVVYLARTAAVAPVSYYWTNFPFTSLDAFKGKKLRSSWSNEPLIEEMGARPQPLVEVLVELIKEADFVTVDITEASSGVIAETSFAIALSKPLFVLARKESVIPAILQGYRVLPYGSYVELDHQLEQVLMEFLLKRLPSLYSAADS